MSTISPSRLARALIPLLCALLATPTIALAVGFISYDESGFPILIVNNFPFNGEAGGIRYTNVNITSGGDNFNYEYHVTGRFTNITADRVRLDLDTEAGAVDLGGGTWSGQYSGTYEEFGEAADGLLEIRLNTSESCLQHCTVSIDNYQVGTPALGTPFVAPIPFEAGPVFRAAGPVDDGPRAFFNADLGPGDSLNILSSRTVSWSSPPTAVPTLSEWGTIILGLLLLVVATLMIRRRTRLGNA